MTKRFRFYDLPAWTMPGRKASSDEPQRVGPSEPATPPLGQVSLVEPGPNEDGKAG